MKNKLLTAVAVMLAIALITGFGVALAGEVYVDSPGTERQIDDHAGVAADDSPVIVERDVGLPPPPDIQ